MASFRPAHRSLYLYIYTYIHTTTHGQVAGRVYQDDALYGEGILGDIKSQGHKASSWSAHSAKSDMKKYFSKLATVVKQVCVLHVCMCMCVCRHTCNDTGGRQRLVSSLCFHNLAATVGRVCTTYMCVYVRMWTLARKHTYVQIYVRTASRRSRQFYVSHITWKACQDITRI